MATTLGGEAKGTHGKDKKNDVVGLGGRTRSKSLNTVVKMIEMA